MYVFYWAENFQNGNYWRSFAFLFLSKTKRNNETEPARRLPEDRSSRQTIYFLPFETVKPIHGGHWYLLRHKWTPNSPVVDPDFQLGRGVGGGGVRGGPFGFHFGLKVRGFRAPRAPSPGSTTAFYSKGTEALNKDLLSKRTSRAGWYKTSVMKKKITSLKLTISKLSVSLSVPLFSLG